MPTTLWTSLELASVDEVRTEFPAVEALFHNGDTGVQDVDGVAVALQWAKDRLGDDIKAKVPPLFLTRGGYGGTWLGYYANWATGARASYTELDAILNVVHDDFVTHLKQPQIAKALELLHQQAVGRFQMARDYNGAMSMTEGLMLWRKEYASRLNRALELLAFDINSDGTVQDAERTGNYTNSLYRV